MSLCHHETHLKHHSFRFSEKAKKLYHLGIGFQTGLETPVSFPERETWLLERIFYFKVQ